MLFHPNWTKPFQNDRNFESSFITQLIYNSKCTHSKPVHVIDCPFSIIRPMYVQLVGFNTFSLFKLCPLIKSTSNTRIQYVAIKSWWHLILFKMHLFSHQKNKCSETLRILHDNPWTNWQYLYYERLWQSCHYMLPPFKRTDRLSRMKEKYAENGNGNRLQLSIRNADNWQTHTT